PLISPGVPLSWQIAGVGDLDGDGHADLVWRDTSSGDVAVWLMNSEIVVGATLVAQAVPLSWRIVKVVDVNGDGKADLIWRQDHATLPGEFLYGVVAIWLMNKTTVTDTPVIRHDTDLIGSLGPTWRIE